jgi:rare lipoprotein A
MLFSKGRLFRLKIYIFISFLIGSWFYHQNFVSIKFRFPLYGYSSWYSKTDRGIKKTTANNEIFNDQAMTCAIWGESFGTMLKVTNRSNGKYVMVRVNDRGPHRRYVREGRVIDLTKAAFKKISSTKYGLISVKVEKIE